MTGVRSLRILLTDFAERIKAGAILKSAFVFRDERIELEFRG